MCFLGRGAYITMDMCFLGRGTQITRDMFFLCSGTRFTRDRIFLVRGTLFTRDMCFPDRGRLQESIFLKRSNLLTFLTSLLQLKYFFTIHSTCKPLSPGTVFILSCNKLC